MRKDAGQDERVCVWRAVAQTDSHCPFSQYQADAAPVNSRLEPPLPTMPGRSGGRGGSQPPAPSKHLKTPASDKQTVKEDGRDTEPAASPQQVSAGVCSSRLSSVGLHNI